MPGHESVTVRERSEVNRLIEDLEDKLNHLPPRPDGVMHKVGRFFISHIKDFGVSADMYGMAIIPSSDQPHLSARTTPEEE